MHSSVDPKAELLGFEASDGEQWATKALAVELEDVRRPSLLRRWDYDLVESRKFTAEAPKAPP